jgi:5-hydroxyisourate hydrolase-like protein (transthyretin family)
LNARRTITRPFVRRAFKLTGRLLDNHGHPIGGANLDIAQQRVGGDSARLIGHAKTGADGSFAVPLPGAPSRLIEVAYRAFSADTNYTAESKITELVRAGVRLEIAPRQASSNGTIVLTGRVLGPVPAQGIVVELLVHYRGRWEPFRDPRTDSSGHFRVVYQFGGGVGRFPFRAEVLSGQASFPFIHGESGAVDVTTN